MPTTRGIVEAARARVELAASLSGGSIMVGFSGGKDALCTLDIIQASGSFRRVECFYMYLVPGLEVIERPMEAACKRYGVKLHKVPHWDLSRMIKDAVLRPPVRGSHKLRKLKLKNIEQGLTRRTGIQWFAYGERATDSYARRIYTAKHKGVQIDGVHAVWRRLWPIYDWQTAELLAYMTAKKIPIPLRMGEEDGNQHGSSGFALTAQVLTWLKKKAPADYQRVLRDFPYVEAQILHERATHGTPTPK